MTIHYQNFMFYTLSYMMLLHNFILFNELSRGESYIIYNAQLFRILLKFYY